MYLYIYVYVYIYVLSKAPLYAIAVRLRFPLLCRVIICIWCTRCRRRCCRQCVARFRLLDYNSFWIEKSLWRMVLKRCALFEHFFFSILQNLCASERKWFNEFVVLSNVCCIKIRFFRLWNWNVCKPKKTKWLNATCSNS